MKKDFEALQAFDFVAADAYLWVFRHSSTARKFNARYVPTDNELTAALKDFARSAVAGVGQFANYGHMATVPEQGALAVALEETDFPLLQAAVSAPEQERQVTDKQELVGAAGYVVKFILGNHTVFATRRAPQSWKTGYKRKNLLNVVFRNAELSANHDDEFVIDPHFDMYALNEALFVTHKRGFESVMQFRTAYLQAFGELQNKPEFVGLFTDIQPIVDVVGQNALQLRRMAAVQAKALYTIDGYLASVRDVCHTNNWPLVFDEATGRIIPDAHTMDLIFKFLLDQRLFSHVTQRRYDVQDGDVV